MRGTTPRRFQGMADPVLASMVRAMGLEEAPSQANRSSMVSRYNRRWMENGKHRDGPVNPQRTEVTDRSRMTAHIRAKARELGADLVGICRLQPNMINLGDEVPHEFVIAACVHEDYEKVLGGHEAVHEEAMRVYAACSDLATGLAAYVRSLGYPARAHHNGGTEVQAIPVFHQVGFGELGRHGSLINETFGADFRPGFVTTDIPLDEDRPRQFGVQDFCMNCNVCMQNCPGDAIPKEYVVTDGVKRWLTDLEKCYPYSRLRKEYCHLCVDVCPFNARSHPETFKAFMKGRKQVGYKTPKF